MASNSTLNTTSPSNPQTVPNSHSRKNSSKVTKKSFSKTRAYPNKQNDQNQALPYPKGTTPYALAKQAEWNSQLTTAETHYKLAIKKGDKVESAIKDLASLMHREGRTQEACDFLEAHKLRFYYDMDKYNNLLSTLKKQKNPSENSCLRSLKISGLKPQDSQKDVCVLFENPLRITDITCHSEKIDDNENHYAIVRFNSHSAACKTLKSYTGEVYKLEWVSESGEVFGEILSKEPTYNFVLLHKDSKGYCIPNEASQEEKSLLSDTESTEKSLLGNDLLTELIL